MSEPQSLTPEQAAVLRAVGGAAAGLRKFSGNLMAERGPHDPRAAALWDAASWIHEHYMPALVGKPEGWFFKFHPTCMRCGGPSPCDYYVCDPCAAALGEEPRPCVDHTCIPDDSPATRHEKGRQ